jgi:fibronectin type 3 domain-containing protein
VGFYIEHYKVYRGTEAGELRLLDTTTNTFYEDKKVSLDNHFVYAITGVFQYGREGAFSDEVEIEGKDQTMKE